MGVLDLFRSKTKTAAHVATPAGRVTLGEMATRDILSGGAAVIDDFLGVLPNPDPVLRKQGKDIEVYRDLLCDEHVGAVVDSRKDAVRELEWSIDRGKAKSRQAKLIEEMIRGLDVYQVITEMLDAPLFGYQPMELIWGERDGAIWLENVVAKPQEWFHFNTRNELRLITPQSIGRGEELPPGKFVVLQHDPRYTNPYGTAVLSRVFWPATFAKGGMKFWVTFTEKYGMPWGKIVYDDDSGNSDEVDAVVSRFDQMVRDGIIAHQRSFDSEIVANGQRASADIYSMLIDVCEKRISKAVLGHGAAADSTPGRLGNEEAAMTAKWGRAASDKRLVASAMNEIIGWIHRYNFADGEPPEFSFYEEEDVDQATAERDQKLYAIGWRPTIDYLVETYGFSAEKIKLLESASILETVGGITTATELVKAYEARQISREGAVAVAVFVLKMDEEEAQKLFVRELPDAPASPASLFSERSDATEIDAVAAAASKPNAGKVTKSVVDPILDLINNAGDYEAALAKLADLYPKLGTDELEEELAKFMFISDVVGRASAEAEADE